MKIVRGKKLIEMSGEELFSTADKFKIVEIDLGTGDGRFAYKSALQNPNSLYIGVDPSQSQMEEYSGKAVKNKVENALYVLGSVEMLPNELAGLADKVHVILPWGSLLQHLATGDEKAVSYIKNLMKSHAELQILFGYHKDFDPGEFERLNLTEITLEYVKNQIIPTFEKHGFKVTELKELSKSDLQNFETTWAKKLTFGRSRPLYFLSFTKHQAKKSELLYL